MRRPPSLVSDRNPVLQRSLVTRIQAPTEVHPGWDALTPTSPTRGPERAEGFRIESYGAHGGLAGVVTRGRTVHGPPIPAARPDDDFLTNVRSMARRFRTSGLAHTEVIVRAEGREVRLRSDDEGYFTARLDGPAPASVEAELKVDGVRSAVTVPVLGPREGRRLAVISDLDDTVIRTGARRPLSMVWRTLTGNAHSRLPFPHVAPFYQALYSGPAGDGAAPFFYVSSSPWNLHDFLIQFLRVHGLPPGVLFLRDIDLGLRLRSDSAHHAHKRAMIDEILETHSELDFILIGDSGQRDPEIYREAVAAHPDRVAAVYLRDVSDEDRDAEINAMRTVLAEGGVDLVYGDTSRAPWRHAAAHRLAADP